MIASLRGFSVGMNLSSAVRDSFVPCLCHLFLWLVGMCFEAGQNKIYSESDRETADRLLNGTAGLFKQINKI